MSSHWSDLLDDVLYTQSHGNLAPTVYCIIDDYHTKKIDVVCGADRLLKLKRRCLEFDPDWSVETFQTAKCDRCNDITLVEDLTPWFYDEFRKPNTRFCERCLIHIKDKQQEERHIRALLEGEIKEEAETGLFRRIQANPERYGFLPHTEPEPVTLKDIQANPEWYGFIRKPTWYGVVRKPTEEPIQDQIDRHIETEVELHANK